MRVLVTRPASEALDWVDDLRRRGFDALALPLIEIAPVDSPLDTALQALRVESFRAVMFVSGNAVRHFFRQVPSALPWPARTRAWAPGPGTAAALLGAGVPASAIDSPPPDAAQFDSETMWEHVAGQLVAGDSVLIARGADASGTGAGRDWLAGQLRTAGAKVETIAVYLRRAPVFDAGQLAQAGQSASDGSVWLFSSSQAIAHLVSTLPGQDWRRARAVATHPRIAQAARTAGFGVVCESLPTGDSVAAALESIR
ncbi:MAG: uroporphyrinogen-III synthase [Ramlibacter sp.]